MQQKAESKRKLAAQLLYLRTEHWGQRIRQQTLADMIGRSTALISAWESRTGSAIPAQEYLERYARFFATRRSIADQEPRLLDDKELTPDEGREKNRIYQELDTLRTLDLGVRGHSPTATAISVDDEAAHADHASSNTFTIEVTVPTNVRIDLFGIWLMVDA